MQFFLVPRGKYAPEKGINKAYLRIDLWNDFSFITMFYLTVFDEFGKLHDLGNIKIGFKGQTIEISTYSKLESQFEYIPNGFFSLCDSAEYYKTIHNDMSKEFGDSLLSGLKDVAFSPELLSKYQDEEVFGTSLMRSTSLSAIQGQFTRVINGLAELTEYNFSFKRTANEKFSDLELSFEVSPDSMPRSNIHAIIGRNGIGKTTILNNMISSVIEGEIESQGAFYDNESLFPDQKINKTYFSSIVSVSFSAFDPFEPPKERGDPSKGTCY